jgi:Peptidase family M23
VSRSLHILILLIALLTSPSHLVADQALPDFSDAIALDLPAQCQLGETCWVVNYVDVDSSVAAKDFQCHERTYNGHDGIDLAIRDRGVMDQGVSVIAAASGTIRRVRDGVADVGLSKTNSREAIAGRECGNGVVIDHGRGWETQYCHLKQHSIRVTIGERVDRGNELGLIGLSGKTEFPHVHLTVRHDGRVIDPFMGRPREAGCGAEGHSLWRDPRITYEDVALYHAGFASEEPQIDAIRGGHAVADTLSADAVALVLWVDIFGVQADDQFRVQITAPDGRMILDQEL